MRAIMWCNGDLPEEEITNAIVNDNVTIFGIDGGAKKAHTLGILVDEILGDMDSVDYEPFNVAITKLDDQSRSDLSKSLDLLIKRGYEEIDIIGVDGGTSEHILGIWASMYEAIQGCKIRAIHRNRISYRYHPNDGELKIEASKTAADYKSALSYYKKLDELEKQVLLVSAIEQTGMENVIKTINQIIDQNKLKGIFDERRADQLEYWIEEEVKNIIASDITKRLTSKGNIPKYSEKVMKNEMSMYEAVETITKDTLKQ